jgi:hypothetical protein
MGRHRLYVSQEFLDHWVDEGRVAVEGDRLSIRDEGIECVLTPAVFFLREVTGVGDLRDLVGRVKDEEQLVALGADAYMDSVLLGDNAYDVQRGFVAEPISGSAPGPRTEAVGRSGGQEGETSDELADFLLSHLK